MEGLTQALITHSDMQTHTHKVPHRNSTSNLLNDINLFPSKEEGRIPGEEKCPVRDSQSQSEKRNGAIHREKSDCYRFYCVVKGKKESLITS